MMRVLVGMPAPRGEGAVEELAWEQLTPEEVATLASTPSLLGDTQTFLLVGALAGELGDAYLKMAPGLVASPHTIIFEEEKLLKRPTEVLTKAGASIEVAPKATAAPAAVAGGGAARAAPPDVFALANAFGMRDKKKCWLLLTEQLQADVAPEAIAGMLAWKVRDLLAKGGSQKYSRAELVQTSRALVALYHDSHRGAGDLSLLLERFVLGL